MFNVNNKATKTTHFPADLVTFTEEILNGKLHFLCIVESDLTLHASHSSDELLSVTWRLPVETEAATGGGL